MTGEGAESAVPLQLVALQPAQLTPPVISDAISDWLGSLGATSATNSATNGGTWVELVKVKKWYSMRLMRWDAENKRKKYVKYLGTLEKCKSNSMYSAEAKRLERRRFAVSGGEIIVNTGAYQPNAETYLH